MSTDEAGRGLGGEPPTPLTPRAALLIGAWIGLVGGYVDLIAMILRRKIFGYFYLQGREFTWTVPLAGLVLLLLPAALTALANRWRPGLISRRAAVRLFTTLALWGMLLRLPIHGLASLALAAGLGRWASVLVVRASSRPRLVKGSLVGLIGVAVATAASTTFAPAPAGLRGADGPSPPRAGSKNVLLIVLDTVRAESLSLYGYGRKTSPNLERWARKGVRFDWAIAPATWSFPSHASFLTGQWPSRIGALEDSVLDTKSPTLAEVLSARGYATAGFVANTTYCSHETRLDRGFAHYEDYPISARSLVASTGPGQWFARKFLDPRDPYGQKWTRFQARDADGINAAFLGWLSRRGRGDRPFFGFLNYFDAHEPFIVPDPGGSEHFGLTPRDRRDTEFLLEYWHLDKHALAERDATLARDSYDDCIAHLDRKIGELLDELDRRDILRDTLVIVTSDHGESFGERGIFDHGASLYAREIRVPLLILGPQVPAGRAISDPASLRDLPATVVDQLGLSGDARLPGRSLADRWATPPVAKGDGVTPALSEGSFPIRFDPRHGAGPSQKGFTLSLVEQGRHFLRDGGGSEEIYLLGEDPAESRDRKELVAIRDHFRDTLRKILSGDPAPPGSRSDYLGAFRRALEAQIARRPPLEEMLRPPLGLDRPPGP